MRRRLQRVHELIEEERHAVVDVWRGVRGLPPRGDSRSASRADLIAVGSDEIVEHGTALFIDDPMTWVGDSLSNTEQLGTSGKGRIEHDHRSSFLAARGHWAGRRATWRRPPREDATKIGIGAGAGAVIGGQLGVKDGAAKGAAIGGGAGTGVVLATKGKEMRLIPGADVTGQLTAPGNRRAWPPGRHRSRTATSDAAR
jgi:hypothetical protein